MKSLHKNYTWELVKLSIGKKIIGCKWIFKKKDEISDMEDTRYKACLVAKGYNQVEGNFNDIFSPIVRHTSIHVLLSLVAIHDLYLEQLDVKIAFLYEALKEQIYIKQPERFIIEEKEDHVCLLKKSFDGLK